MIEQIQGRVKTHGKCVAGKEAEVVLSLEEAARLDCVERPLGLDHILVCWSRDISLGKESLYAYAICSDGRVSGDRFSPKHPPLKTGAVMELDDPPVALILRWATGEDRLSVGIRVETEDEKIDHAWDELCELSAHERLVGFVKLWSEVKYNFAFFEKVPEVNWDNVLEEYLPGVMRKQTTEEYYRLLKRCLARLRDGHTGVNSPFEDRYGAPPVEIRCIEGKAIITSIAEAEEVGQAGLKPGDEITQIDGRSVYETLEKERYPYISASSPQGRDGTAYKGLLRGPRGRKIGLRVRSLDGWERNVTLTRARGGRRRPGGGFAFVEYKELPAGVAYIALNSFASEEVVEQFDEVFEELRKAKGLLVDVRRNKGGNSNYGNAIIGRLTDKPLQGWGCKTRKYIASFHASGGAGDLWHGDTTRVEPRGDAPFLGPVVVLVGPDTGSAAEDFLVALHGAGRVTLVGEKTAGTTGQPLFLRLPGGGQARICTIWCTYPDGREFVGVGVVPDVGVCPAPQDIASGRDVVLEKGIEVLKELIEKRSSQ